MAKKKVVKKQMKKVAKKSTKKAAKKAAKKAVKKIPAKSPKKVAKKITVSVKKKPVKKGKTKANKVLKQAAPEIFQSSCVTCSWTGYVGPDRSMAVQDAQFHESEMMSQHQSHSTTVQPAIPLPPADTVARPDQQSSPAL